VKSGERMTRRRVSRRGQSEAIDGKIRIFRLEGGEGRERR